MVDFQPALPPNFDAAQRLPLGQHPADDAENFLYIAAFRVAVATKAPIAQRVLAEKIVDRRMIHDQLVWRASQRPMKTLNNRIFLNAVARSKR